MLICGEELHEATLAVIVHCADEKGFVVFVDESLVFDFDFAEVREVFDVWNRQVAVVFVVFVYAACEVVVKELAFIADHGEGLGHIFLFSAWREVPCEHGARGEGDVGDDERYFVVVGLLAVHFGCFDHVGQFGDFGA